MGTRALSQKSSRKTTSRYNPLEDTPSPLAWVPCEQDPLIELCIGNICRAPGNANGGEWSPDPPQQQGPSSQGGVSLNVYNIYILIKILFGLSRVSVNLLVLAPAALLRQSHFRGWDLYEGFALAAESMNPQRVSESSKELRGQTPTHLLSDGETEAQVRKATYSRMHGLWLPWAFSSY